MATNRVTFDSDRPLSVCGVSGRLTHRTRKGEQSPSLWLHQRWISEARKAPAYGAAAFIRAEVRFDDECGNKHNTIAVTGDVWEIVNGRKREVAGGCLHEDIARVFPELAHLIPWHLSSTDGPMHYLANTIYLASDRDHNKRRKGEPCAWEHGYRFNGSPVTWRASAQFFKWIEARRAFNKGTPKTNPQHGEFRVVGIAHDRDPKTYGTHYTFAGFGERWHECPFRDEAAAQEIAYALNTCSVEPITVATAFSEGKARELDAARSAAVWPDATDAELSAEPAELSAALAARLPALLARMRADVEACGFYWSAEDFPSEV